MGHLTRRSLLGSALAGSGALLAPRVTRALATEPAGEVFELSLPRSGPLHAQRAFDLVGIEWEAPERAEIRLRTRRATGAWSPWLAAPAGHGHGPDRARPRLLTDPIWTGGAELLEVHSSRPLEGARAHLVEVEPAARAAALRLAEPQLAAGPGQPPIVARSSWASPACRPRHAAYYGAVEVAFVHHTAGTNGYGPHDSAAIVRSICLFHRNVHGWNDIGYNFLVDRYGQIFEGRAGGIDEPLAGAQAGGYNLSSTGVAMLGTYSGAAPTPRALEALASLLAWKLALHGIDGSGATTVEVSPYGSQYSRYRAGAEVQLHRVAGHRDGDTTTCPGSALYGRLSHVRRRVTALQGALSMLTAQVAYGTTLSGVLTSAGQPLAGAQIELQQRTRKGERTLVVASTAGDGSWSATPALARNATLRALYRGAPGVSAVVSPALDLAVRPQITLQAAAQQTTVGIPVQFSGTVAPAKKRVTLVVSQLQLDGSYTEVREIPVAVDNGAFSRGVAFGAPGQYQLVAQTERDATNAPGASPPVAITAA